MTTTSIKDWCQKLVDPLNCESAPSRDQACSERTNDPGTCYAPDKTQCKLLKDICAKPHPTEKDVADMFEKYPQECKMVWVGGRNGPQEDSKCVTSLK